METPAAPRLLDALRSTVPTDLGRRFLELTALLLVVAVATSRPDLYAGAALLLGLYAVAHLGALYAARSLEASWSCPDRAFAGEPFPVRVSLRNRGLATLVGIEIPDPVLGPSHPVGPLAPGGCAAMEVVGRLRRRGRERVRAPALVVRWPFLLAYHLRPLGEPREVLVYPRRVGVPERALRSSSREPDLRGSPTATLRGGEIVRGLREWAPGDPARAIAWRATARHGRLLTREFEEEDGGRAVVLLEADGRDLPARERRAAVERACSLAASLLLRLRARGRRTAFAACTPDPILVPSIASERGLGRALEALALYRPPRGRVAPAPRESQRFRGTRFAPLPAERPPRPAPGEEARRDPLSLLPPGSLRGALLLRVTAAHGEIHTVRGPEGARVTVIPSLRATFAPRRPA